MTVSSIPEYRSWFRTSVWSNWSGVCRQERRLANSHPEALHPFPRLHLRRRKLQRPTGAIGSSVSPPPHRDLLPWAASPSSPLCSRARRRVLGREPATVAGTVAAQRYGAKAGEERLRNTELQDASLRFHRRSRRPALKTSAEPEPLEKLCSPSDQQQQRLSQPNFLSQTVHKEGAWPRARPRTGGGSAC